MDERKQSNSNLICIGQGSSASSCSNLVLVGTSTSWLTSSAVAVGNSAGYSSSSCSNSVGIGNNTKVFNSCVAVGHSADSTVNGVVNSSTHSRHLFKVNAYIALSLDYTFKYRNFYSIF